MKIRKFVPKPRVIYGYVTPVPYTFNDFYTNHKPETIPAGGFLYTDNEGNVLKGYDQLESILMDYDEVPND